MRSFKYYEKEKLCSIISFDVVSDKVVVENFTDFMLDTVFGYNTDISVDDVYRFLESRTFPKERANCKELLSDIGLKHFDIISILHKTHGVLVEDFYWLEFDDENLSWEKDIRGLNGRG